MFSIGFVSVMADEVDGFRNLRKHWVAAPFSRLSMVAQTTTRSPLEWTANPPISTRESTYTKTSACVLVASSPGYARSGSEHCYGCDHSYLCGCIDAAYSGVRFVVCCEISMLWSRSCMDTYDFVTIVVLGPKVYPNFLA